MIPEAQARPQVFERDLKRALAEVVLLEGAKPDAVMERLGKTFDLTGVEVLRSAPLEMTIRVKTLHQGTHWFRMILKAQL